jgi:hypothetical protein
VVDITRGKLRENEELLDGFESAVVSSAQLPETFPRGPAAVESLLAPRGILSLQRSGFGVISITYQVE